jgi:hypothetical protein
MDTLSAISASDDDGLCPNRRFSDDEIFSHDDDMYSEAYSDSDESISMIITVNRFRWCHCMAAGYDARHLALLQTRTELGLASAAALSYAIGDFGRTLHVLGHHHHDATRPFRLTFGAEWDLEDVKAALVDLTDVNWAIWLDQLSITQIPAEIALFLPRIPRIYSVLKVVVLLPNAPYPCLRAAVKSYHAGSNDSRSDGHGGFDLGSLIRTCYNAFPVSSYHSRFWTLIEFQYARRIGVHFVSVSGPCGSMASKYIQHTLSEMRKVGEKDGMTKISADDWLFLDLFNST